MWILIYLKKKKKTCLHVHLKWNSATAEKDPRWCNFKKTEGRWRVVFEGYFLEETSLLSKDSRVSVAVNVRVYTCLRTIQCCLPSPPSPVGPISCISWLWLMFPSRFCRPPSPPSAESSWPLPPPLPAAPGMGGLFKYSFTLRQNSSSLSVFGSWRKLKEREFCEIRAEFSTDQITSYSHLVTRGRSYRSQKEDKSPHCKLLPVVLLLLCVINNWILNPGKL